MYFSFHALKNWACQYFCSGFLSLCLSSSDLQFTFSYYIFLSLFKSTPKMFENFISRSILWEDFKQIDHPSLNVWQKSPVKLFGLEFLLWGKHYCCFNFVIPNGSGFLFHPTQSSSNVFSKNLSIIQKLPYLMTYNSQ